jgi:hypothetical protein
MEVFMKQRLKMKWGRVFMAFALMTLIFTIGSCDGILGKDEKTDDTGGVDFTNHNTNAAIRVRNLTNQRLVLFKNELSSNNILGGVDANAGGDGWGIKKDPKFFTGTQEFAMVVLTLDQYNTNKSNLSTLAQTPFTRVYVFYNAAGENEILYELSDKLGGSYRLQVENPTNLNVELRQGGVNGPTLGYAPSGMQKTTLYVTEGDLDFFPVFKRYNKSRNIVETIYPKGSNGYPWMESFVFGDNLPDPQSYDIKDALKGLSARTSGVAYLKIVNSSGGAVRLYKGSAPVYNTFGISYMPNDSSAKEFEIFMPETQGHFDEKLTVNNYKIGPTGGSVAIVKKDGNVNNPSDISFDLYGDKSYTVTVTGNYNQGNLKAEIDIDGATDVSFDFFTFND